MSKAIDLVGQRFGNLTVISKDESYVKPSGQKVAMWKCMCDCGNTISIRSEYLRSGSRTSCGCIEDKQRDIVGQRFGRLVVVKEDIENKRKLVCQCDCGKTKSVNRFNLMSGKIRSCGCLQIESRYEKIKDLSGETFGRLTVINRVIDSEKNVKYLCKCKCGNETICYASNLKRGLTTSCGCFRKEKSRENKFIDLTGQIFGKLTVLNLDHQNESTRQYYWNCICECGNECVVYGGHLKDGHTSSCGCINSMGERLIASILKENNIEFQSQYSFSDLKSNKNYPLYFDFGVIENGKLKCLIEYQGIQHYSYDASWKRSKEAFENGKIRDDLKRNYCSKNSIPLIEIPYWDFSKINYEYIKEKIDSR